MSEDDEQFQQRWGLRRNNESDADSSSDDQSKQPNTVVEPERKKHKIATRLFPDKKVRKVVRIRKPDRKAVFDYDPSEDGVSIDLTGYMENLGDGVKVAREGLLKWMEDELQKSVNVVKNTPNPKSKTPRNKPNKARRKPGVITKKTEEGCSESDKLTKDDTKASNEKSEVVIPSKELEPEPAENVASVTIAGKKNQIQNQNQNQNQKQKQKAKAKRVGGSSNKQKVVVENDKLPENVTAAAGSASGSNYLTLPAVLPRQDGENSENINSEGENGDRGIRSRNGIFTQRNVTEYEQNIGNGNLWGNGNGNVNGSGFSFGIHSQGGIGMPNFGSQFGMPYFSQESVLSGLRMNGGHPIIGGGNHGFGEGYGGFNQQLRFQGQGGGLMPLHSPDNTFTRAGNLQSR